MKEGLKENLTKHIYQGKWNKLERNISQAKTTDLNFMISEETLVSSLTSFIILFMWNSKLYYFNIYLAREMIYFIKWFRV